MASLRPAAWTWPQVLLAGLTLAVLVGVVVALSTSVAAFGVYNPAWDGASDLDALAEETGAESRIALNTTAYDDVDPNRTIAVILAPDTSYSEPQQARLREFVADGGTLVIAEDVGPVGNELAAAVGADTRFDGRPVRDDRHYYRSPAFPTATNVTDAPETEGVEQVTLNHGTTLHANETDENTTVLVRTSSFAYLDTNRNAQLDDEESLASRPVVVREHVGNGTVIAISDPSLFINAMLERPGNRQFARNLFAAHEQVLLDQSGHGQQPPLSVALLTLRETPPMQVLLGLGGIGTVLVWSRRPGSVRRLSTLWVANSSIARWRTGSRRLHRVWNRLRRVDHADIARETGDAETVGATELIADPVDGHIDADALAAYLRQEHPEWDDRRIQRVITGVLARRREVADDDRSG